MYQLWTELNTKPWEINGGVKYPEDIVAMLDMLRMHNDAERMRQEHEARKAKRGKGGRGGGGGGGESHYGAAGEARAAHSPSG